VRASDAPLLQTLTYQAVCTLLEAASLRRLHALMRQSDSVRDASFWRTCR
jgi:hypothetical protein